MKETIYAETAEPAERTFTRRVLRVLRHAYCVLCVVRGHLKRVWTGWTNIWAQYDSRYRDGSSRMTSRMIAPCVYARLRPSRDQANWATAIPSPVGPATS